MSEYTVKNQEIFNFLKSNSTEKCKDEKNAIAVNLLEKFGLEETTESLSNLKQKLTNCFFSNYNRRLSRLPKNKKNHTEFESVNSKWLQNDFSFQHSQSERNYVQKRAGRPTVLYEDASLKTKQRRNIALANRTSINELCDIANKKMKLERNNNGAKILSKISDPAIATEIMNVYTDFENSTMRKMSPEEALEMLISCSLTKHAYKELRLRALRHGHDLYPSYDQIVIAKKKAYPQNVYVSESKCEVTLQDLMDQTVKSLFNFLKLPPCPDNTMKKFILIGKYGFDGTTTNRYKQKSVIQSNVLDYTFCSSFVPLKLIDSHTGEMYWMNPKPSSTRFCRPIRILYEKETDKLIKQEEAYLKQQIDRLTDIEIGGYRVGFDMLLTMIDGKVCNALHDTSSQRCFLCKATISKMNDIDSFINIPVDESGLRHGISVLHAHIRFMELVLHISYRQELKLWRVGKDQDNLVTARKKEIQDGLYNELGLLVDFPTQGSGNTNDGNTARRFFNDPEIVARITGFDIELLRRYKVILAVISTGLTINVEAFKEYAERTARRFVSLYEWYYMPPSMHVILLHGYRIMKELMLPIGMLSEEAQESNHKNLKRFRKSFCRKQSRVLTNEDTFLRLLLFSDPQMSLLYQPLEKKSIKLSPDMKKLLNLNDIDEGTVDSD